MTCEIDSYDTSSTDFYNQIEIKKARKEHICSECFVKIHKGDSYIYECGVFDGEFGTNKICKDCQSLRGIFFCTYTWGGIWEEFEEYIYDNSCQVDYNKIERLTPKAKARAIDIIDECFEDSFI